MWEDIATTYDFRILNKKLPLTHLTPSHKIDAGVMLGVKGFIKRDGFL